MVKMMDSDQTDLGLSLGSFPLTNCVTLGKLSTLLNFISSPVNTGIIDSIYFNWRGTN